MSLLRTENPHTAHNLYDSKTYSFLNAPGIPLHLHDLSQLHAALFYGHSVLSIYNLCTRPQELCILTEAPPLERYQPNCANLLTKTLWGTLSHQSKESPLYESISNLQTVITASHTSNYLLLSPLKMEILKGTGT